jgi:FAD:protein FMN transferase
MSDIKFQFEAIGTHWVVEFDQPTPSVVESEVLEAVRQRIEAYDQTYSRFRKDSVITQISQNTGEYVLPEDSLALFSLYYDLYKRTSGKFTPLIGQVLVDAGYDSEYSLDAKILHTPDTWESAVEHTDTKLTVKVPTLLDFGAGGKGHLIDLIGEVLHHFRITSFLIDGSGDLLHRTQTEKKVRIGLEHPDNVQQVIGVAELGNGSLCASAGNRRKWGNFHHIIDPTTLQSAERAVATWVIADQALLADALATCLFLEDATTFQPRYEFEYAVLHADYSLDVSAGFTAEFFFKNNA